MGLTTPTKPSRKAAKDLFDDRELSNSPKSVEEEEEEEPVEEWRKRFVGDVDLPESECYSSWCVGLCLMSVTDQEPLLIESKRRFVLFPIQYHEVCLICSPFTICYRC